MAGVPDGGVRSTNTYGDLGEPAHGVSRRRVGTYRYDHNGDHDSPDGLGRPNAGVGLAAHQRASVTGGPEAATFVYEADGSRLLRTTPIASTLYLDGMEIAATATATTATRYYGSAAMRTAVATGGSVVQALLHDPHGSATFSYDTAAKTWAVTRYQPYGRARGTALSATDHRFLGQPEDTTGLVATGARYYDPVIGRFTSVDPLADLTQPQSLAGNSYALDNPTSLSDPSGLEPHQNSDGSWGGMGCANGECNGSSQAVEDNTNSNLAVQHESTRHKIDKILGQLDSTKKCDRNAYLAAAARDCPPDIHGALCEAYYRVDVVEGTLHPEGVKQWLFDMASIILLLKPVGIRRRRFGRGRRCRTWSRKARRQVFLPDAGPRPRRWAHSSSK